MADAASLVRRLSQDTEASSLLPEDERLSLLTQLKILGRDPKRAPEIYSASGIDLLGRYGFGDYSSVVSREACRCIANALLLMPDLKSHFAKHGMGAKAVAALKAKRDDDDEFILCRILFLLTYDPKVDFDEHVVSGDLAQIISAHLWRHAKPQCMPNPPKMTDGAIAAVSETLKLLFNITNRYPKHNQSFRMTAEPIIVMLQHLTIPRPPLQPPLTWFINTLANLEWIPDTRDTGDNEQPILFHADGRQVKRLVEILDLATKSYQPVQLDTQAIPLLTVLRNINAVHPASVRPILKAELLPKDSERTQPLGKSASLPSRLLQLTTAAGVMNLQEAVSGLLFEVSDSDPGQYVKNVGYGFAAGYLLSHHIPVPESVAKPSQSHESESNTMPINPITGQRLDREPEDNLPEMTDEEKGREAERLFVLFERLKATGVVDVENPVRSAMQEGRLEELSDSESG